jgi:hypothetical protein
MPVAVVALTAASHALLAAVMLKVSFKALLIAHTCLHWHLYQLAEHR